MIPEAAVEALAMRNFGAQNASSGAVWADAPSSLRASFLGEALKQCEAAAPHMLANAWQEGWDKAQDYDLAPNPYEP